MRVVAREYPCLSGERTPAEVGSEIDSFLSDLPGSELVGPVDENVVQELHGPSTGFGTRKPPATGSPWSRYVPDVYDKAIEHLRELFRAQGYLSASVGPPILVRRACDPSSPPGVCRPLGPRLRPSTECRYDAVGLPIDERPVDPQVEHRRHSPARAVKFTTRSHQTATPSRRSRAPGAWTSCRASGSPPASTPVGSEIDGTPAELQGAHSEASPVQPSPAGAGPGAVGDSSASCACWWPCSSRNTGTS